MTPEVPAKGAIVVRALTLRRRDTVAVDGLDGRFAAGSMTAVHGPNGAGKTTLLEALAGLLAPSAGTVTRGAGSRVAYLPQQSEIDRRFPIDVHAVVALGAWPRTGAWRGIDATDRAAIDAALDLLGIADLATRAIASLSTGQFQRVLFARVIVQDADIVLLDEPFNAVDQRTTTALMEVLHRLHDEGRTVIAALHDVDQIRDHFDRTLSLARHCVAWGATSSVLRGTPRMASAWIDDAQPVSS